MIGSDFAVAGCCRSLTPVAKDYFDDINGMSPISLGWFRFLSIGKGY